MKTPALHLLLVVLLAFGLNACEEKRVDTSPEGIAAELNRMLLAKDPAAWEKRLDPGFKQGFGGEDPKKAREDFKKAVTEDPEFRSIFSLIIASCAKYTETLIACPAAWVNCKEDDMSCGTQPRIVIDPSTPDWKIQFYGAGD